MKRVHRPSGTWLALLWLLLLTAWAPSTSARAESILDRPQLETLVTAAQAAYDRGVAAKRDDPDAARAAFEDAAAGFREALAQVGPNGELWFNLGNAELQLGHIGQAILAFRSAEALLGSTSKVQASLTYARSLRRDQIPSRGGAALLQQVIDARNLLPPFARLLLTLLINALFWGLLCLRLVRRVPWLAIAASGLVAALLAFTVALDLRAWSSRDEGVVVADEVVLRTGNGEGFGPAINERLSSGLEVRILEQRPAWLRVALPDGTEGWLREGEVGVVGAPDPR